MEKGLRMIRLFWLEHQKHKTHKTQYPNHLTGFSADTSNNRRDDERSTSPAYFYLPYNIYYDPNK